MKILPLRNTLLKKACFCIATFLLFFFMGCTAAKNPATVNPPLTPAEEAQKLVDAIQKNNTSAPFRISLDTSSASPVVVITATNEADLPLAFAVNIPQEAGVLTTNPISFTVTASQSISAEEISNNVMLRLDSEQAKPFKVKTVIIGSPIDRWLTSDSVNSYIKAAFSGQMATLSLNDATKTLSIIGLTNADNGADGSISFTLPKGFSASPSSMTFPDPDGLAIATSIPSETSFTISETANSANRQSYTINAISFAQLRRFAIDTHIRVSDSASDITDTLSITEANRVITITGLTNTAGSDKRYTLTIPEVPGVFSASIPCDDSFSCPGGNISISITEPAGLSPGDGILSATMVEITNQGEATGTTYTLQVPFEGRAISDWMTPSFFNEYFTEASFDGQVAPSFTFDGNEISISGVTNRISGALVLTVTPPLGYTVSGLDTLSDPDGDIFLAAVTNSEIGSITITKDGDPANAFSYPVKISLAAYVSPVKNFHITATNFAGREVVQNFIDVTDTTITISGVFNVRDTEAGTVSIAIAAIGYTISPEGPFTFENPTGNNATNETNANAVIVTNSHGFAVPHSIIVQFAAPLQIRITDPNIISGSASIVSGGTITMASPCEILVVDNNNVRILNSPVQSIIQTGFTAYYYRDSDPKDDTSGSYIIPRRVQIIEDVESDFQVIDPAFIINIAFPACDDENAVTTGEAFGGSSRDGLTADTAYQIDNAPKLELLSLLSSVHGHYRDKHYELTADIDMGITNMPWSESTGGEGFSPIAPTSGTRFYGIFDCKSHTISNLYINRPTAYYVALFGHLRGNNTRIKNCGLSNANITGNLGVAGFAGILEAARIENSYVVGSTISGSSHTVGGLAGSTVEWRHRAYVQDSYVASSSISGGTNVGGLIGSASGAADTTAVTLRNSYVKEVDIRGSRRLGGLIGTGLFIIENSYSAANSITATATGDLAYASGITSTKYNRVTVSSSYWDITKVPLTQLASSLGLTAGIRRTTAQMQVAAPVPVPTDGSPDMSVYVNWDTNIWSFAAGRYPALKTVACPNKQLNPEATTCTNLP